MLHVLFNKILCTGSFPKGWSEAIIVPIFKKGDAGDPNNFRGISLLSCLSKILTEVLNNRLVTWAKNAEKMYEMQGGFTVG